MADYQGKRFRPKGDGSPDGSSAGNSAASRFPRSSSAPQTPPQRSRYARSGQFASPNNGGVAASGGAHAAGGSHAAGGVHAAAGSHGAGGARPAGGSRFSSGSNAASGSHARGAHLGQGSAHPQQPATPRAQQPTRPQQPATPRPQAQPTRSQQPAPSGVAPAYRRSSYTADTARSGHSANAAHPSGSARASRATASRTAAARTTAPRTAQATSRPGYSASPASRAVATAPRSARRASSPREPRRRDGRAIASKVLIGVGVLLLLVAAGIFIWAQIGYQQAGAAYDELSQYVTLDDSQGDGVPVVDWDALAQQSEDIVAWIYIPNTDINFPVVQGETNEQYLRALPDGTWNQSGSIMLDCDQAAPGMVGQQTTVYGHHMSDGSMFDPIENTLDQANFDAMPTVYYLTPETTYKLTPLYTARVPETYVEARQENFGDEEKLVEYLRDLHGYAQAEAADVDTRMASADRVLALVTCSGMAPADHRAVMICTVADEYPTA